MSVGAFQHNKLVVVALDTHSEVMQHAHLECADESGLPSECYYDECFGYSLALVSQHTRQRKAAN
jgi:hypothetical protein